MMESLCVHNVEFEELEESHLTYNGITSEVILSIKVNNTPIGIVYLNNGTMEDGVYYIEWLEFLSVCQGKHLLRPVMTKLSEMYGPLQFQAAEGTEKKYDAIGAVRGNFDEDTENYNYTFKVA